MTLDARERAHSIAHAYLAALGGTEPDAVAELVADDFVNEHQNPLGNACVGREAYRERLPGFFATFPGRRYDVVRSTVGSPDDDGVIDVVARYHFRTDVVLGGGEGDGARTESIDIPGVMWIEVKDDQVVRRVDTWDAFTYFLQSGDTPPGFVRTET